MHRPIDFRRLVAAIVLLAIASISRLLLQMAVMPPYAGLDELFHVARLSFRVNEQRESDGCSAESPDRASELRPRRLELAVDGP